MYFDLTLNLFLKTWTLLKKKLFKNYVVDIKVKVWKMMEGKLLLKYQLEQA